MRSGASRRALVREKSREVGIERSQRYRWKGTGPGWRLGYKDSGGKCNRSDPVAGVGRKGIGAGAGSRCPGRGVGVAAAGCKYPAGRKQVVGWESQVVAAVAERDRWISGVAAEGSAAVEPGGEVSGCAAVEVRRGMRPEESR
jgi:hypothetical protein